MKTDSETAAFPPEVAEDESQPRKKTVIESVVQLEPKLAMEAMSLSAELHGIETTYKVTVEAAMHGFEVRRASWYNKYQEFVNRAEESEAMKSLPEDPTKTYVLNIKKGEVEVHVPVPEK